MRKAVLIEERLLGGLRALLRSLFGNAHGNKTAGTAPAHGLIQAAVVFGDGPFVRSIPAAALKHGLADFIAEDELEAILGGGDDRIPA